MTWPCCQCLPPQPPAPTPALKGSGGRIVTVSFCRKQLRVLIIASINGQRRKKHLLVLRFHSKLHEYFEYV